MAEDWLNAQLATASAKNQMAFQERMSNTAHQREVADLKAAGLNPVLSAGGSGASTPQGAEGDYSNSNSGELLKLAAASVSTSAKAVRKTAETLDDFNIDEAVKEFKNLFFDDKGNPKLGVNSAVNANNVKKDLLDYIIPKADQKSDGTYKYSQPSQLVSKLPFGLGSWITAVIDEATNATGRDFGKVVAKGTSVGSGVVGGIQKIVKDKKSPSKKSSSSYSDTYRGGTNR